VTRLGFTDLPRWKITTMPLDPCRRTGPVPHCRDNHYRDGAMGNSDAGSSLKKRHVLAVLLVTGRKRKAPGDIFREGMAIHRIIAVLFKR